MLIVVQELYSKHQDDENRRHYIWVTTTWAYTTVVTAAKNIAIDVQANTDHIVNYCEADKKYAKISLSLAILCCPFDTP